MLQTKFMLIAAIAFMAIGSAIAIIGGQDASLSQFPYFAFLETYKVHRINFLLVKPLVMLEYLVRIKYFQSKNHLINRSTM